MCTSFITPMFDQSHIKWYVQLNKNTNLLLHIPDNDLLFSLSGFLQSWRIEDLDKIVSFLRLFLQICEQETSSWTPSPLQRLRLF